MAFVTSLTISGLCLQNQIDALAGGQARVKDVSGNVLIVFTLNNPSHTRTGSQAVLVVTPAVAALGSANGTANRIDFYTSAGVYCGRAKSLATGAGDGVDAVLSTLTIEENQEATLESFVINGPAYEAE